MTIRGHPHPPFEDIPNLVYTAHISLSLYIYIYIYTLLDIPFEDIPNLVYTLLDIPNLVYTFEDILRLSNADMCDGLLRFRTMYIL